MTDLTKITTPFGLLDEETQGALRAHQGPIEYYSLQGQWEVTQIPSWALSTLYRAKPRPPKPRELWVQFHDYGPAKYQSTREFSNAILMREVLS